MVVCSRELPMEILVLQMKRIRSFGVCCATIFDMMIRKGKLRVTPGFPVCTIQ